MIGNVIAESKFELVRLGKFTSSKIDDLFTEPKSKVAKDAGELSETAKNYINTKAAEIITGTVREITTSDTEWGNLYEPEAAEEIKKLLPDFEYYGGEAHRFLQYDRFSGGSPDGVAGKITGEIKCPSNPANHVEYGKLKTGLDLKKTERGYYHQIQMNMACLSKKLDMPFDKMRAMFFSYCPLVKPGYKKLISLEIFPEEGFCERLDALINKSALLLVEYLENMKEKEPFNWEEFNYLRNKLT